MNRGTSGNHRMDVCVCVCVCVFCFCLFVCFVRAEGPSMVFFFVCVFCVCFCFFFFLIGVKDPLSLRTNQSDFEARSKAALGKFQRRATCAVQRKLNMTARNITTDYKEPPVVAANHKEAHNSAMKRWPCSRGNKKMLRHSVNLHVEAHSPTSRL